jgi:cell shape-determining protein MreC
MSVLLSVSAMLLLYFFRVNTKEKDLLDKLAESSAKHQESNEENNKLKDQLKSNQDNLKYVINDKNNLLSKHWPKEPYLSNFKWKRA